MTSRFATPIIAALLAAAASGCGKEKFLFLDRNRAPDVDLLYDDVLVQQDLTEFGIEEKGVDVLWVIDNSGSMMDPQAEVQLNASYFIDEFTKRKFDWKMGLISTTVSDEPYLGLAPGDEFTSNDPLPIPRFVDAVHRLGTGGDGMERPFDSVLQNLTRFPGFKRPQRALTVIFVTDAPEQSGLAGKDFHAQLKALIPAFTSIFSYGVFNASDFGCTGESGSAWSFAGSPYEEFFGLLRSQKALPMCSSDYGVSLAKLGREIIQAVGRPTVNLSRHAVPNTVKVYHEGRELPEGPKEWGGVWMYDPAANAIVFHDMDFAKNRSKVVSIQYKTAVSR